MSDENQDSALDFVAYRERSKESAAIIKQAAATLSEGDVPIAVEI